MRVKKVVCVCFGILIFISFCGAIPMFSPENMVNKMQTIYPYGLHSLSMEVISLCGINFILLFLLVNKIKNKKDKNMRTKFFFIIFFVILFCAGECFGRINREVPMSIMIRLTDGIDNMDRRLIVDNFVIGLLLIDIVYLIMTVIEKMRLNKMDSKQ